MNYLWFSIIHPKIFDEKKQGFYLGKANTNRTGCASAATE